MVRCSYKKKIFEIEHIWFSDTLNVSTKADISYIHGIRTDKTIKKSTIQHSLITDLKENEEDLYAKIRKNYRYEIRRIDNEDVQIKCFKGKEILNFPEILDAFEQTYNEMYQSKGMSDKFNRNLVLKYIDINSIIFTIAYFENKPLVFHSYIYDTDKTRFYYSASPFRVEKSLSAVIGRMNKALHWYDIKLFKTMGLKEYDWGGISNPEEPNGIDQFKMAFGGDLISYQNITKGNTIQGKVALMLWNLKK